MVGVMTSPMTRITVRLADDLAKRFDAVAEGRGGRSELLRKVIEHACEQLDGALPPLPVEKETPTKIHLRLSRRDAAKLDNLLSERRMKRTEWIVSLIQRKLHGAALLPPDSHSTLVDIRKELRFIGKNVNQAVKALHAANMEESRLELPREAARVAAMKAAIDEQMARVRAILHGELSYWDTPDE